MKTNMPIASERGPAPVQLSVPELEALAAYFDRAAVTADELRAPKIAGRHRRRAQLVREAITAYEALGDRLCETTADLRGRIGRLEAQLRWVFRGRVVREHLPITRADVEAHVAAEEET